jgi:hypothetical protein
VAGIWNRSAATDTFTRVSVTFDSITIRPFSSYFWVVATRTPSTTCQSDSTRS